MAEGERLPELDMRLGHMRRTAQAARVRLSQPLRQLGAVGPVVAAPAATSRSVIVDGHTTRKVETTAGQVQYLTHKAGRDGEDAHLFTREGVAFDRAAFIAAAQQDGHQFRFSVNPEQPPAYMPMQPLIESVMARVEKDLGRPLDWVAAVHHDTGRPHAHVIVRGRDREGAALYITQDYLKYGLGYRARQLATLLLGPVQAPAQTPTLRPVPTQRPVAPQQDAAPRAAGESVEEAEGLRGLAQSVAGWAQAAQREGETGAAVRLRTFAEGLRQTAQRLGR